MRFPVVHLSFLPAAGMAIFPFVLIKYRELKADRQIINHELIHLRQQIELLIIPFFILYLINYLVNLIKYRHHDRAYRNIIFEREAYENDANYSYLKNRRFASWIRYLRQV
ncbi:MAG: hypothetical protein WKF68_14075 [Daejeonella sp.]